MDSDLTTYLQMLQAIISRMAGNSFLLKGWSVTLVSALFALAADKTNGAFASIAVLPVLMFWGLDGYFLRQERLFRKLYDRGRSQTSVDFSMDTSTVSADVAGWLRVCMSRTLLSFHLTLVITVAIVNIVIHVRF